MPVTRYVCDPRWVGRFIWKYLDTRAASQGTNRGVGILELSNRLHFRRQLSDGVDRRKARMLFGRKFGNLADGATHCAGVHRKGQDSDRHIREIAESVVRRHR